MGVSILYSAIPPGSDLYKRLNEERAFAILMSSLFVYGNGIFRFFEIESEEVEEILEWVVESQQDTFGSELEVSSWINEFRSELDRTRNAHPGVEDRTASLEKTADEIQQRLLQELIEKQIDDAGEIANKLIYGDRTLAPHLLPEQDSLGVVSRLLVRLGATILQEIYPETLFTPDELQEEWASDHYRRWRNLYLAANENNEEILIGIA
jgi:hypothetical protein